MTQVCVCGMGSVLHLFRTGGNRTDIGYQINNGMTSWSLFNGQLWSYCCIRKNGEGIEAVNRSRDSNGSN